MGALPVFSTPVWLCVSSDELPAAVVVDADTKWGRLGLGICYDLRFPHLAAVMAARGCRLLVYPGAFNTTTGPPHWELLLRGRALDNQLFVAGCSPARNDPATGGYPAWGHSSVVSPWGKVVATTDHTPGIVHADIDLAEVDSMRYVA